MVMCTDHLDMTIAVDWDVKNQVNQLLYLCTIATKVL